MQTQLLNDHQINAKIGTNIIGKEISEIVCISLNSRPERQEKIKETLKNYPFRFYIAQLHENPARGCLESHINCIKYAKEKNLKNILILEDDAKLVDNLENLPEFPDDWQMIYFGGLCVNVIGYNGEWIRGNFYCGHAYLISETLYDEIINNGWNYDGPLDHFYVKIMHDKCKAYSLKKSSIIQESGYSDIDKKNKWDNFKWPNVGEMFYVPL